MKATRNPIDSASIPEFLNEQPYVKSATDFCLGKSLEDAGKIVKVLEGNYGRQKQLSDGGRGESDR